MREWLRGAWSLPPDDYDRVADVFGRMAPRSEAPDMGGSGDWETPRQIGGVLVLQVRGVMMPTVPAMAKAYGFVATGVNALRQRIMEATENPRVKAIALVMASPGGYVQGMVPLAKALADATRVKPTLAATEGMCLSSAYWLASQAKCVTAGVTDNVGSVGVYVPWIDRSRLAESVGMRTELVTPAALKARHPDQPLREEQRAELMKEASDLTRVFVAAVAEGRRVPAETAAGWATGAQWRGEEAKALGLIDGVGSAADFITELTERYS